MTYAPTECTTDTIIAIVEDEAKRHTIAASDGRIKICNCDGWQGGMGSLAGFRDHVVIAIIDALRGGFR